MCAPCGLFICECATTQLWMALLTVTRFHFESNLQNNDIFLAKKKLFFVTDTLKSLMEHEVVVTLCHQAAIWGWSKWFYNRKENLCFVPDDPCPCYMLQYYVSQDMKHSLHFNSAGQNIRILSLPVLMNSLLLLHLIGTSVSYTRIQSVNLDFWPLLEKLQCWNVIRPQYKWSKSVLLMIHSNLSRKQNDLFNWFTYEMGEMQLVVDANI